MRKVREKLMLRTCVRHRGAGWLPLPALQRRRAEAKKEAFIECFTRLERSVYPETGVKRPQ